MKKSKGFCTILCRIVYETESFEKGEVILRIIDRFCFDTKPLFVGQSRGGCAYLNQDVKLETISERKSRVSEGCQFSIR